MFFKYCISKGPQDVIMPCCREKPTGWNTNIFYKNATHLKDVENPKTEAWIQVLESKEYEWCEEIKRKYENM